MNRHHGSVKWWSTKKIRHIESVHRPSRTQLGVAAWALHIGNSRRRATWAARSNCFLEGRPLVWLLARQVRWRNQPVDDVPDMFWKILVVSPAFWHNCVTWKWKHLLETLHGLPGFICIADDIVIYGKTSEEHNENLRKFLERCLETGIKLNKDKLDVRLNEVTFMGHRITKEGLRVDPVKVSVISEMQSPNNINELRRFMGMANYLARFMPHLTDTTQPLHNLIKNDVPYVWSKTQKTFDAVKVILTDAPVLAFYNSDKELVLENDASKYGLGSVLLQNGKPLLYASRSLPSAERNYAQIEKEMLSVLLSFWKFQHYTCGRDVTVVTDHKPLVAIRAKSQWKASKWLQHLLLKSQEYSYQLM